VSGSVSSQSSGEGDGGRGLLGEVVVEEGVTPLAAYDLEEDFGVAIVCEVSDAAKVQIVAQVLDLSLR
jgi:hypothetical protein